MRGLHASHGISPTDLGLAPAYETSLSPMEGERQPVRHSVAILLIDLILYVWNRLMVTGEGGLRDILRPVASCHTFDIILKMHEYSPFSRHDVSSIKFHSSKLLSALGWIILSFAFLAIPIYQLALNRLWKSAPVVLTSTNLNWDTLMILILIVPSQWITLLNNIFMLWPIRFDQYKNKPRTRHFERFIICLVTRGDNVEVS